MFSFKRRQPIAWVGGGIATKQIIDRRIEFDTGNGGAPVPNSLIADVKQPWRQVLWIVAGVRLAGVLDVRLDATAPIGEPRGDSPLRLIIGRAFPITASAQ
jgi:hypothetical protein